MKYFTANVAVSLSLLMFVTNVAAQDVFNRIVNSQTVKPDGSVSNEITYTQDFSAGAKVEDLTNDVYRICDNSKSIKVGDRNITIRFSDIDVKTIDLMLENLSKVLEETTKNLAPLPVDDLEIFLLPLDNIKFNFKLSVESKAGIFYFLKPYRKIEELNLDCLNGYSFGHNIFLDIPHELTHNALRGIIDQSDENDNNYPRWFEEGLADFNSIKVAGKLNPCWVEFRTSFTNPLVSLNRKEIYTNLFAWRRDNKVIFDWIKSNKSSEKITWNELAFFGASYQFISDDFDKDDGKKLHDFLSILQSYKEHKTKIQNRSLIKLYKDFVGDELEKKPKLESAAEKQIVQNEADFIVQDFRDNLPRENKIKRYKALSILASTNNEFNLETLKSLIGMKKKLESSDDSSSLNTTYIDLM